MLKDKMITTVNMEEYLEHEAESIRDWTNRQQAKQGDPAGIITFSLLNYEEHVPALMGVQGSWHPSDLLQGIAIFANDISQNIMKNSLVTPPEFFRALSRLFADMEKYGGLDRLLAAHDEQKDEGAPEGTRFN